MRLAPMLLGSTFLLLLQHPISAQEPACSQPDSSAGLGAVMGNVVDVQTQIPLGFVQIRLRIEGVEEHLETRSAPSGKFQFCSIPAGAISLTGQLGQLGGIVGPLFVEPGETKAVSLQLSPPITGVETGTLAGIVKDEESREPVSGATVMLSESGQTAITNELGRFTFPSLSPGETSLQVSRLGYGETTGAVEIEVGKTTEIEVSLSMEAIPMDPLTVTAVRRRIVLPDLEDFERRYYSGWGKFILENEIQARAPTKLTQVLYEAGVDVDGDGRRVRIRRTGCAPLVYLDGVKLTHMSRGGGGGGAWIRPPKNNLFPEPDASPSMEAAAALNLVHPSNVIAVEVYRGPAETPGQYIDSNSRCGVILVWTRRGNISGK